MRSKNYVVISSLLLVSPFLGASQPEDTYKPHGATETLSFEMGLHDLDAGSELAVPPRPEILESAIPRDKIPAEYVKEAERNVTMVFHPSFLPEGTRTLNWRGLPRYYYDWDVIVADCAVPSKEAHVYIAARARGLSVTIDSGRLFLGDFEQLKNDDLVKEVNAVLRIPPEKLPMVEVEMRAGDAGGTPIRFGKLRCEYDERTSSGVASWRDREWWSLMLFVVARGMLNLETSIYDGKKNPPPASALDPWRLEDVKMDSKDGPK